MKHISILVLFTAVTLLACNNPQKSRSAIVADKNIENRIEEILSKMTLEEKIGQMTQLTLDVIGKGSSVYHSHLPFTFDEALLDTVIRKYKVGSILNTPVNTPLPPQEWQQIIERLQKEAIATTGIPIIYGLDQIHGSTYVVGGTLFPQAVAMGATFNPDLVKQGAEITAYETKASSVPWNFSPVLDLGRDPRWSRMWETYSEDSYLVSVMGKACVEGYQGNNPNAIGNNQVAACLKHFMGYGVTVSGKDRTPSSISIQDMKERHFAPFVDAIRAGALSVMVNSGMNNSTPYHINYEYITLWLKEGLQWDGVVVTDWADINNIYSRDKVASSKKEAVKLAINAGIDMSMVPYEWSFCNYLRELVEEGEVKMDRIDDAVRRILRMKLRLNLFDKPNYNIADFPDFGSEKHAEVARNAAREAITLLKNKNNLLPLSAGVKVLVTGPNANSMRTLNGGWTLSWQGEKADLYGEKYNTIVAAIQQKIGKEKVVYEPGITYKTANPPTTDIQYFEENEPQIEKTVSAARGVDYIILCLGENSYCETPGNLEDLTLSKNQLKLAEALAKTGKPVILVLNEGRPRVIATIEPLMSAVIQTYLPGNYGGEALAEILWGDVNPSGKLPYTYPKAPNSLITYDHKPCENIEKMAGAYDYNAIMSIQWAFGYGLSYTTFEYSNLTVNQSMFTVTDTLIFTVDVTNTGKRAGKESVLLFTSDLFASITPDVRRLRAFSKIALNPSEKKTVIFKVPATNLAFIDVLGEWLLEKGDFQIQVGDQTLQIVCKKTLQWRD